ncbi:recombinase family protein [Paenibacillus sp. 481]|uniref:recombinase family protein n=1 Tax=Paenibacillus sp. 481 TaxID=2835869 RepID=UPI001E283C37|nr:recombinase family protein [Paenibacillus sp. 481]UHA74417.1 recombinase family protein [Paenibacillus sp. 481]
MIKLKKRSRGYVRVSTLKRSQKDSPKHQEASIRENAVKLEKEIDHVYVDRATGTSIMERDDVQNIIRDAKNGEFDTLFFSSLSRFSRDTYDALALKRTLVNALGIRVISIEDFYDSGIEDNEMIFTVISSVNQKLSESISTGSKRGKRQAAKAGGFTGSIAPFGYRKVIIDGRKTLEIVEHKAEIVRLIFDLYVNQNMGEKCIVAYLNEELKIPSPTGKLWGITTIQGILKNRNYTGYNVHNKMKYEEVYDDISNLHDRRKKLVQKLEEEWEVSKEPTHPAIIPVEIFEAAQDTRARRGGGKRGGGRILVNVFARRIFCKECGYAMVIMGHKKKLAKTGEIAKYHYLVCSGRRRMGRAICSNDKWVPYYDLQDEIVNGITKRIRKMIDSAAIAQVIVENVEYKKNESDKELKRIENTLVSNRKLLFEIRKQRILEEMNAEQYEFEREIYEREIISLETLKANILESAAKQKDADKLLSDVRNALDELCRMDFEDVTRARVILSKLIEKVTVSGDGEADVHTVLG